MPSEHWQEITAHEDGIASKNADTDWLPSDFTPVHRGTVMRITVQLATSRAIKAVTDAGTVIGFNSGTALPAGYAQTFDLPMVYGTTYNLQNVGGASAIQHLYMIEIDADKA